MMAGFSLGDLVLIEMCKIKISSPLLKYWQYVQAMAARVFVGVVNSQRCKYSSSCTLTAVHIQLRYASLVNAVGRDLLFSDHGCLSGLPVCLKKNQNAHRPSEHPPGRGKNVKTFR